MKKNIFLMSILIFFCFVRETSALEKTKEIDINGILITKEQYENLINRFDPEDIMSLDKKTINLYKNKKQINTEVEEIYIKEDYFYDSYKNLMLMNETKISKEKFNEIDKKNNKNATGQFGVTDYHETTYKKISLKISAEANTKTVTLTNEWKKLPVVRSFDILALGIETGNSLIINNSNTKSGYQKYDRETIYHNSNNDNWGNDNPITKKILSLSQNLVDSANHELKNSITVTYINGNIPFTVRGTYQHAITNISLTNSKNYSASINGLGGLLDYNNNNWYDNTSGLRATVTIIN